DAEVTGLRATVVDAEYLGHETLLHVRIDGMTAPAPTLIARLSGIQLFEKGKTVRLSLDSTRLHLFGPDGLALDNGVTAAISRPSAGVFAS
ncbi:MAG TPA: TOBE domain-containing protein, partial [Candidatus Competibacter sp.]|nr:TOBE domain-containing protein [Candidatus Competibacter sp.]